MEDVTIEEVEAAAKESTLAAVRCSMRHWLYNTSVNKDAANFFPDHCALCRRFGCNSSKRCTIGGKRCPLSQDSNKHPLCCDEYYMVSGSSSEYLFRIAAHKLYAKLARIEYDLMHKEEKEETYETPHVPGWSPVRITKLDNGIQFEISNFTGTLTSLVLAEELWRKLGQMIGTIK
jgi:hypothetical protein